MYGKLKFKKLILNDKNYIVLWFLSFLIFLKIMAFILLFTLDNKLSQSLIYNNPRDIILENPEGYISFLSNDNVNNSSFTLNKDLIALIFFISFCFSFITRIHLILVLKNDHKFIMSGLNLKIYRILLFFWPSSFLIKIIAKSYHKQNNFTTRQLIIKWKIVNLFRDLFSIGVLIGMIVTLYYLFPSISQIINNAFKDFTNYIVYIVLVVILSPLIGFSIIAYPTSFISLYSAEIYNEILQKEGKQWKKGGFIFFVVFIYLKAWSNVLGLEKDIKNQDLKEKQDIGYLYNTLNKETIIKFIWHTSAILSFVSILTLAIKKVSFIGGLDINTILGFWLFLGCFIYIGYFTPRYIANIMLLKTSTKHIKIMYIIDLIVPILSVYNIINYHKKKEIYNGIN